MPPNAYVMWMKAEGMQAIKDKHPNASCAEIGSHAAVAWGKLDTAIREQYEANFLKANERWHNECRMWHEARCQGHSKLHTIAEYNKGYDLCNEVEDIQTSNNATSLTCPQIGPTERDEELTVEQDMDVTINAIEDEDGEIKPVKPRMTKKERKK